VRSIHRGGPSEFEEGADRGLVEHGPAAPGGWDEFGAVLLIAKRRVVAQPLQDLGAGLSAPPRRSNSISLSNLVLAWLEGL